MTLVRFLATLAALLLWALPAAAQRVDCGNGNWCPEGNACLTGGMCAERTSTMPPGSTRLASGNYGMPGERQNRFAADKCIDIDAVECHDGGTCPAGMQCGAGGDCTGGAPPTGPMCGQFRCSAGDICAQSVGHCINPQRSMDCGNGVICSAYAACTQARGCAIVTGQRTRQRPH
jgi:hypothetical protein